MLLIILFIYIYFFPILIQNYIGEFTRFPFLILKINGFILIEYILCLDIASIIKISLNLLNFTHF
jgi:hypothetical protein